MRLSPERLALGAALITVTLWASAFVGIRAAGEDLSAGALSLGRLLIGSVILGAVVLARREPLPPRTDAGAIVICGVLWFGIYNGLASSESSSVAGWGAALCLRGPRAP